MDEGKTVTDTGVIWVLATKIGLPREDLVTVKLHEECKNSSSCRPLPVWQVFGAAGVLPAELNSPSESISSNESLVPISLSPATRSPPHDTRIAEKMQEVPVNRALSPVHSSKPVEDLPLMMECPPALTPTPSSLAHIPQAPLAQVPWPFKNTFSAANPVEPPARTTAFDLLRTGSWPSLCPGRRDWASASIAIPLPIQEVTWHYIISDRRIPLLAGILLCKSQELSRREHSTSRLCSIHHDIPEQCTLQLHMVNGQCLTTMVTTSWWSSGQDMWLEMAWPWGVASPHLHLVVWP